MTTALIDADIVAYRAAAKTMSDFDGVLVGDPKAAIAQSEIILESWMRHVKPLNIIMCWSCETRKYFRHDIWPDYKGNRKGERPPCLPEVTAYLKDKYRSVIYRGLEADDVLGILGQSTTLVNPIAVSIDKDMQTLPIKSFNPDKMVRPLRMSVGMADRLMFTQALTGDSTDNYKGALGIGPAKAAKIIDACRPSDMWSGVRQAFLDAGHDETYAITMVRLARILRADDYNENGDVRLWLPHNQGEWMTPSALNTTSSTTESKPSTTSPQSVPKSTVTKPSSSPTSSSTSADTEEKELLSETSTKPNGISNVSKAKSTKKKSNSTAKRGKSDADQS